MPQFSRLIASALTMGALLASAGSALAGVGQPSPWQLGLQDAASPVMVDIVWFHDFLLWIISAIALFVLVLLADHRAALQRPRQSDSVPHHPQFVARSRLDHRAGHYPGGDCGALVPAAVSGARQCRQPDLTVKATGKQWFWSYSYPDNGNFEFNSLLVADKDLKPGQPRLLTVDNELVVPVNKVVHVLVTGADVIHSFAVPSFGIKIDAVPGRLNDTWFKATSEGLFHGQCSELCGKDHAFMPITVKVVSEAEFNDWVAKEKKSAGLDRAPPTTLAASSAPTQ